MDEQFEANRAQRYESRESKEAEVSEELKAAAAMERADYLVREVKSSKQQMQNIVMHMQEVKQAIKHIRAQLQLAQTDDSSSLVGDAEQVEKLKKKIAEYATELVSMRGELIAEQKERLKESGIMDDLQLEKQATDMVDELIQQSE